jgi:hypothetical protein
MPKSNAAGKRFGCTRHYPHTAKIVPESVVRSAIVATATDNNRGVMKSRYCQLSRPGFEPGHASRIKNPCPAALSFPAAAVLSRYCGPCLLDQRKACRRRRLALSAILQGSWFDRSPCPDLRTRVGIHLLAPITTAEFRRIGTEDA